MNNLQRFFENEVNVPHTVLSLKLQPLSLRHMMWLQHLESPLIYTAKPVTLEDLELAVLVCSSKDNEETLKKLSSTAGGWFEKLVQHGWRWLNRSKVKDAKALQGEIRKFLAYQDDCCCLPEFMQSKGAQKTEEKMPYMLTYAAALIKSTGWSEETVFNMPLGKVIWYNSVFGYLNTGETNVLSDEAREGINMLKQLS